MNIKIKRVYEQPDKEDGLRILVDRLWPRGLTKEKANTLAKSGVTTGVGPDELFDWSCSEPWYHAASSSSASPFCLGWMSIRRQTCSTSSEQVIASGFSGTNFMIRAM